MAAKLSLLTVITILLLLAIAVRSISYNEGPSTVAKVVEARSNANCGFVGNSDLYGLGIRLGVYFQWLSGIVAQIHPESWQDVQKAYTIFLFAILIATMILTANASTTAPSEIFILFYMFFGGGMLLKTGKICLHMNVLEAVLLSILEIAMTLFGCWFWLHGLRKDFLGSPGSCEPRGFFFTNVSLYKPAFVRFFSAIFAIYAVLLTTVTVVMSGALFWFMRNSHRENPWREVYAKYIATKLLNLHPAIAQLNKSGFPLIIDIFTQVFKVFYLVFSVLGIELTLVWNHISGIYTVGSIGQLIPFVIGLGGLIQVCYDIWKERILKRSHSHGVIGEEGESGADMYNVHSTAFQHADGKWRL